MPVDEEITKQYSEFLGTVKARDVLIVYGDVHGNVKNCKNVIIINGDVKGNVKDCENVAGLLAHRSSKDD